MRVVLFVKRVCVFVKASVSVLCVVCLLKRVCVCSVFVKVSVCV